MERDRLRRWALRLEYVTIGWNVGEVVVTIVLGVLARSLALVAFGLDAVIEIFASGAVVAHLREHEPPPESLARTHRHIGLSFLALAVVLAIGAIVSLANRHEPDESIVGIVYLAMATVAMLSLAIAKRRIALRLGDGPLAAEAGVTYLDAALAASILTALVLNAVAGWWWVDAVATLVVAAVAANEGRESFEDARKALET
ncbi:MAG TPA: cation transporter [Acidimicrobiia bacterium]|nr:cation transporter [Acidimicrobiia bacterium]